MSTRIHLEKEDFISMAVLLYFVALAVHNLYGSLVIDLFWYLVLGICFVLGVLKRPLTVSRNLVFLELIFIFFAVINMLFVGNATINSIVFTVVYAGIYLLFIDDRLKENYVAAAIYVDCVIYSLALIAAGLGNKVMDSLSNNFISVFLLLPASVYYIRSEYYGKKASLWPAVAIAVTCLLATGRSGIITAAALLLLIYWNETISGKKVIDFENRRVLRLGVILAIVVLAGAVIAFSSSIGSIAMFQRFTQYGMYGTGRIGIWTEYITTMVKDTKSILLGVDYSRLPLMVRYRNNLHNSFFNIHADFGIVVLLYLLLMFAYNTYKCAKMKCWVYLSIMLVFFLRACTDRIFGGGSAATPVLFFILLFIHDKYAVLTDGDETETIDYAGEE